MRQITKQQFEQLPRVRVVSSAGPCLTHYRMVRRSARTVTVAYWNGDRIAYRRVAAFCVHETPCALCPGRESYPHGYQD